MKYHFKETLEGIDENILLADGFEDACIGYIERAGLPTIACYDKNKCLQILRKDMDKEEAEEFFHFNVLGSYVGEYTPCFLTLL
tara:strand:- start:9786 stop:10037 length:252 start_codon:yes stop_codon:yes gene_type:complete